MAWNQKIENQTQICTNQGTDYCLEWTNENTVTYNYFNFAFYLFLFFLPIIFWKIAVKRR